VPCPPASRHRPDQHPRHAAGQHRPCGQDCAHAGGLWQEVAAAAAKYGLVGLAGSSPDVGVVGYTLGGGMSWLGRAYGLSANNVQAFEAVTADGRLVRADAVSEPDLFWALRGGGGSFAVVTAIELRRARALAGQMGHRPLQAQIDRELPRIAAARSGDDLTGAEQRVAEQIADGATSPEAAGTLFVSVRTVETHVASIYRKLGVHTRSELRRTLSAHPQQELPMSAYPPRRIVILAFAAR
jgi:DNA-binding CsgD family transcriptional regulator